MLYVPDVNTGEIATSPMMAVRPKTTDEEKHKWFNMRADKAAALLDLCYKSDTVLSTRQKIVAVIKRKLANSLLIPTSANASFHGAMQIEQVSFENLPQGPGSLLSPLLRGF